MIAYFPSAYPDELLYSRLARYYAASGYMAYTFAAEDLFISKIVRPDIEFVNTYTPAAFSQITKNISMETVVEKHTMFPYYGHFLPVDRRRKAFEALVNMTGDYHNLLPIPQNKSGSPRCLRYCPKCAESDRESYGETYWHRTHQMIGLNICPVHWCYLHNSNVNMGSRVPPSLKTAEEMIPQSEEISLSENETECRVAEYMTSVFQADVDMDSNVNVGDYLYSRMANTKYRSVRGEQRNITLLHSDFTEYYKSLPNNWFTELWQLQKVLTGDRLNFYEICLLAMFLNISPAELTHMEITEKSQQEIFDKEVYRLHEQGMKYPEIAKALNAPYDTVKAIGERRYGTVHRQTENPLKGGVKAKDWHKIDLEMLPLVREAIHNLQGDSSARPKKITVSAIEKMLDLSGKTILLHLPLCLAEIRKHEETQEQYWAKEVVWAVRQIGSEGQLNWRRIRDLTNMRRTDFERCLPYIRNFADTELSEQIRQII